MAKRLRRRKGYFAQRTSVVTIEWVLEGEDSLCHYCAMEMKPIGKNTVRTENEFIPPYVKVIEYVQYVYKCPKCGTDDSRAMM